MVLRVDLKCFHYQKEMVTTHQMEVEANIMVVKLFCYKCIKS